MTHSLWFLAAWVTALLACDYAYNLGYLPGGTISLAIARLYARHSWARPACWLAWSALGAGLDRHFATYVRSRP